jgi:hypothetical protein
MRFELSLWSVLCLRMPLLDFLDVCLLLAPGSISLLQRLVCQRVHVGSSSTLGLLGLSVSTLGLFGLSR